MTQETFLPVVATENGKIVYLVGGRKPYPASKKWNPIWWLGNEWDPDPPDWSMPGSSMWLRRINWWFRNPFHNFGRYVLGVGDKNYKVIFERLPPKDAINQPMGLERASLVFDDGKTLPWFFYGGKYFNFYWGWQPTGFAGLKLNKWALLAAPIAPLLFLGLLIRRWV